MKALFTVVLLAMSFTLAAAPTLFERELVRGRVTDCVAIEGVECETTDNYIQVDVVAQGRLIEVREGMELVGIQYDATIADLISGVTYKVADTAFMSPNSRTGARYTATSRFMVDEFGNPLVYDIDYIRRQQQGVDDVKASIMVVQFPTPTMEKDTLIFLLDYRDLHIEPTSTVFTP